MGTTETGLQQGSHGVGVGGEESPLLVSSEGVQYTVPAAVGSHGLRQNPGYRWSGVCPHTGSRLLYFPNTVLTNCRYKSGMLPSGKPKVMTTRALLPLLPRQRWLGLRALDGPGCHLYPLTYPRHPLVSFEVPSVSIGEGLGEGQRA